MPRTKSPTPPPSDARTRARLLEAAGEVFAERGYASATIREICTRAGANIAAVNYYFGDKDALYAAVLEYAQTCAREKYPIRPEVGAPAEKRLRDFVHAFLLRLLDRGRPAWHGKLMAREMVQPSAALEHVIEHSIRPHWEMINGIVAELVGGTPGEERVKLCAISVMSQCLIHRNCRPVLEKLWPRKGYTPAAISLLADHVTAFSLAALSGMRSKGGRR